MRSFNVQKSYLLKRIFYNDNGEVTHFWMGTLALFVGVFAGFGAVVFRGLIGGIHNLLFLGKLSFIYDANLHMTVNPWHAGIIFVPVLGAIVVAFLVKNFAPEAKGHGVPEVMDAIYQKDGCIRPIVVLVKSLASAISIGSGGSVGREGPIVQIGSTFGSILGRLISMPPKQCVVLIAAGAAGGIAATFNTPLGALVFAVELMLVSISASTIFPVAIATVTATYIGRKFLGMAPSFYIPTLTIPSFHFMPLNVLLIFIPFGLLLGLLSVVFIRGIYFFEDLFDAMPGNYYTRHMFGMLLMGILMFLMFEFAGNYYAQGVGYAAIVDILKGALVHPWFLIFLVVVKMLATFLTLGSGASGGIFSPSLFLGAAFGAAFGLLVKQMFPMLGIDPVVFAMAGMAGMIGGTTGAVLTAVCMVLGMTQTTQMFLPTITTAAAAYAVRRLECSESIYTLKLLRRGVVIPQGMQAAVAGAQHASHIMTKVFEVIRKEELNRNFVEYYQQLQPREIVIVEEDNKILGVIEKVAQYCRDESDHVDDYINKRFLVFPEDVRMPEVVCSMKENNVPYVLIVPHTYDVGKAHNVVGVITYEQIFHATYKTAHLLY